MSATTVMLAILLGFAAVLAGSSASAAGSCSSRPSSRSGSASSVPRRPRCSRSCRPSRPEPGASGATERSLADRARARNLLDRRAAVGVQVATALPEDTLRLLFALSCCPSPLNSHGVPGGPPRILDLMTEHEEIWLPLVDEPIGSIVAQIQADDPEIERLVGSPRRILAFRTFAYIRAA